jgi:hypothetical protein
MPEPQKLKWNKLGYGKVFTAHAQDNPNARYRVEKNPSGGWNFSVVLDNGKGDGTRGPFKSPEDAKEVAQLVHNHLVEPGMSLGATYEEGYIPQQGEAVTETKQIDVEKLVETLEMMRKELEHRCSTPQDTSEFLGQLRKAKNFTTFGTFDTIECVAVKLCNLVEKLGGIIDEETAAIPIDDPSIVNHTFLDKLFQMGDDDEDDDSEPAPPPAPTPVNVDVVEDDDWEIDPWDFQNENEF